MDNQKKESLAEKIRKAEERTPKQKSGESGTGNYYVRDLSDQVDNHGETGDDDNLGGMERG